MRFLALVCDYDGTIARDGAVAEETRAALERLRSSGRKLVLVTGRILSSLERAFDGLDLFDRVVAENGAVIHDPATRQTRAIAAPPPEGFVEALRDRGVAPLDAGTVIVATREPNETAVLEEIKERGLELQVIFNKGAVMVLPAGVTKATGMIAALDELHLSPHNVVGIGDAENDHAFLGACECAVAVADALEALRSACDHVTRRPDGEGVVELVERLLDDDLASLAASLPRHDLLLGHTDDRREVRLPGHGPSVLVAGPSGSGKSTLVSALLERLEEHGRQYAVIDPEEDYGELDGAAVLGDASAAPKPDEAMQVLDNRDDDLVINLLGVPLADRPSFFRSLLPRLLDLRGRAAGRTGS